MDFFRKKKESPSETLPTSEAVLMSDETTPYQSGVPSDFEKDGAIEPSVHSARSQSDAPQSEEKQHSQEPNAIASAEEKLEAIEKDEEQENEDDIEYPKAMKLTLITIALCLSVFCMALDNTIISTAIPKITDEFKAINDVGWYGSAYLLTTCAFQLFFGKLYTFLSLKYTYLTALAIFEIGSAVCGAAPHSTALIIGRAVAGLGSAGIFSGAILIVANTVPLRKRPTYMVRKFVTSMSS